jgi:hypothetical protein
MPPEAGCSITSGATAGATGNRLFRAALFTGARLGLARFVAAAFAALRLLRLAEFPLRSFARSCGFDCFLRLAMNSPRLVGAAPNAYCRIKRKTANADSGYNQLINSLQLERSHASAILGRSDVPGRLCCFVEVVSIKD